VARLSFKIDSIRKRVLPSKTPRPSKLSPNQSAKKEMKKETLKKLLLAQKREITEYYVYLNLAKGLPPEKSKILLEIAEQEKRHYETLKKTTGKEVTPSKIKIVFTTLLAKILGLNFTLQLMERGEIVSQSFYRAISEKEKELAILRMVEEEREHERKLIALIDEKRLAFVGDFILGLNDALVELTGALAGLTLALSNTKIIAMVGLITGIAASLSMGASNYLAAREQREKEAMIAGSMTGIAYIITVLILVSPYLIFKTAMIALIFTFIFSVLVVGIFNFYVSVAKRQDFASRFSRMIIISFSVAAINFGVGSLIKRIFGIEA
jgi:VIT1/CCC1 family predicted Fe2+/Mn2+ transporter